jgi:hypothetical protein
VYVKEVFYFRCIFALRSIAFGVLKEENMASVAQYLEKRATNVFPDPADSATLSFLLSRE